MFNASNPDTPAQDVVAFHRNSDVDFERNSQHHTLGYAVGQAAPGEDFKVVGPQTLAYSSLYLDYAPPWEAATIVKEGKWVSLQGLILKKPGANGPPGLANYLFRAPEGMRPAGALLITCLATAGGEFMTRFNLDTDGFFYLNSATITDSGYVNVTGVRWRVK